jgi:hypothetical protein
MKKISLHSLDQRPPQTKHSTMNKLQLLPTTRQKAESRRQKFISAFCFPNFSFSPAFLLSAFCFLLSPLVALAQPKPNPPERQT